MKLPLSILLGILLTAPVLCAATAPLTPDIPQKFTTPTDLCDYEKREVMIPMRDGVKLFTVIVVPRGAQHAPILLKRTPYNATKRTSRAESPSMLAILPEGEDVFVEGGYICVWQDVRGKYGSEGDYVMTRPARGPLNDSGIDHTTDAWDTIDWLVKNVPESNGSVGMIGSSYEGFTTAMALLDPHPALKVAAPQSPMVDGWMGDDWFHYGAFRQATIDYYTFATAEKKAGPGILRRGYDDYENFLAAGSAGDFGRAAGLEQLPWWRKLTEHPAYDAFWQEQAVDRLLAKKPLTVPTMWLQGLWDQEDMWGTVHTYPVVEQKDTANDKNFLVLGPWRHSQVNGNGSKLGPLAFDGDTAREFRRDILRPFFDQYLKPGAAKADTPPVLIYNTGEKRWQRFQSWPADRDPHWSVETRPLYLAPRFHLDFAAPAGSASSTDAAYDEYVSDPAKPVPYLPRPIRFADQPRWQRWLVEDQRPFSDRPDVLTYVTEPLHEPLQIGGAPLVHLVASTSGTDSDWVVKLIDVFPPEYPVQPELGGYQLGIAMDIFRGRYRDSFEHPQPLAPNQPLAYEFALPHANHTFLPGHRIMVQIQSSWFPLYDRNPQSYVENLFFAKPGDYVKATQRIYHTSAHASRIDLPVLRRR
ncbi:CocE/NonD family hydrolase [Opitutus terrae]|uniref:Peptidase S15 n=1 Tax=Opitutus terrae (strain DSM 11246 / JCM 15787 / PB90-1) TaxID=452637 RepID=B1ZZI4_OPITP|nr:CocE/NonD family hydrolase [Opitutus terrae]ACB76387.1 peptidase S15 [Opitutus terrae PB90-1]